jgi:predicted ATPase
MLNPHWSIAKYLKNIRVYRFDPLGAKEPDSSSANSYELDSQGHNIATMLSVLEKDADIREQIIEWMELLVPSLETISTERSRLDARTMIRFKEAGIKANFPAHLISDGTIYALCIMVAVLGRCKQPGMTLIEEPERGIHPQAIAELVSLMRENANPNHAIFVTTHSESVVRHSKPEELWLVNKIDGKTEFKNAGKKFSNLGDLSLDKAWLMNFFGGGLPW